MATATIDNIRNKFKVDGATLEFSEVLGLFIRSRNNGTGTANKVNTAKSIKNYEWNLSVFFNWMTKHKRDTNYSKVSHDDVTQFIEHYQQKGLSPESVNVMMRCLKAMFRFVNKDRECRECGFDDMTECLPKIPHGTGKVYVPTSDQMLVFLNSFDQSYVYGFRDYVATTLMLDCGARIGELCWLTPEHIKFERNMILIPREGKTNERLVPMSPDTTAPLLKRWLKVRDKYAKTPFLFINRAGGKCINHTFDQSYAKHRAKTGVGNTEHGNLTPHTVRHFFCTYYLVNGGTLPNLQLITGHKDVRTLMIYVHLAAQISSVAKEHLRVSPLANLKPSKKTRKMF